KRVQSPEYQFTVVGAPETPDHAAPLQQTGSMPKNAETATSLPDEKVLSFPTKSVPVRIPLTAGMQIAFLGNYNNAGGSRIALLIDGQKQDGKVDESGSRILLDNSKMTPGTHQVRVCLEQANG